MVYHDGILLVPFKQRNVKHIVNTKCLWNLQVINDLDIIGNSPKNLEANFGMAHLWQYFHVEGGPCY